MKDQLQQELLAKIKLGTKPSDIKKMLKKPAKKPISPSPIVQEQDLGYESDKSNTSIPTASPLSKSNPESASQIKTLQKQLNLYKDFREADLKIKEKYKQTIKEWEQKYSELEKASKNTEKVKETLSEQTPTSFTCSSCTRVFNIELIRLAKKSGKKICRNCTLLMLKRANQFTGQHIVLKVKKSPESQQQTKAFTCQTCQQPQTGEPHQVHVSNYQEAGINPRQLANICSTCLNEKVNLANFYCPRTSEGRDTYDPKEPQFDCDCPTNERSQA